MANTQAGMPAYPGDLKAIQADRSCVAFRTVNEAFYRSQLSGAEVAAFGGCCLVSALAAPPKAARTLHSAVLRAIGGIEGFIRMSTRRLGMSLIEPRRSKPRCCICSSMLLTNSS